MDKKVSAKRNGKWWTYGSLKVDPKYGNLRLSFKNSAELKELVNSDAEWINFSLFDREERTAHDEAKANGYQRDSLDDDIPFAVMLPLGLAVLALASSFSGVV